MNMMSMYLRRGRQENVRIREKESDGGERGGCVCENTNTHSYEDQLKEVKVLETLHYMLAV